MKEIKLGAWEDFRQNIKNLIKEKDLSTFASWPILLGTMIAGVDDREVEYLKNSKNWEFWLKNLKEDAFKPNSHHIYSFTSTNNLHHAYSLQIMMENLEIELKDFSLITEFGGGYGNMARLFRKCEFKNELYIYDLPELLQIQKYYLDANKINDVNLISDGSLIKNIPKGALFIALWSITETPTETRDYYIDNLKIIEYDNIFFAFGDKFINEDNMTWLEQKLIPKLKENNFSYKTIKIPHGNGMYYFSAKRNY